MKILLDLEGVFPRESSRSAIQRASLSLARALAEECGSDIDLRIASNLSKPQAVREVAAALEGLLPPCAYSTYRVPLAEGRETGDMLMRIGTTVARRHYAAIEPDVLHTSRLLDEPGRDFCLLDPKLPHVLSSATFHPPPSPRASGNSVLDAPTAASYRAHLAALRKCDLLVTLSEASRQDAVALVGIKSDAVVNISRAPGENFRRLDGNLAAAQATMVRYGLSRPFVVSTGEYASPEGLAAALEAFASLPDELRRRHQLLLITSLHAEESRRLLARAGALGLAPQDFTAIEHVPADDLVVLLNHCLCFFCPSPDETLGLSVLEAIACGAPALVANSSSLPEIIDRADALFRTSADGAGALARILADENVRSDLSHWGLRRAGEFTWRASARTMIEALRSAWERTRNPTCPGPAFRARPPADVEGALGEIADALAPASDLDQHLEGIVDDLLASIPIGEEPGAGRLVMDVTATAHKDYRTGIQRVVRDLTRAVYGMSDELTHRPEAVRLFQNRIVTASEFLHRIGATGHGRREQVFRTQARDTLLMLDSTWVVYDQFRPAFDRVRGAGGRVITVVYDLVPVLHPDVTPADMPGIFSRWLAAAVECSDGLVCISRAVADELLDYIADRGLPFRDGLTVGWFHLGSNLAEVLAESALRPELEQAFAPGAPILLMVGTLEPRKGHAAALTALEQIWAEGRNVRLCVLGKKGWHIEEVAARIRGHPEHGRRLLWFENTTDAEIRHAYKQASALLFPSIAEGFGLPIVEAARAGLPPICSDLPVLREITGDQALYFRPNDPASIAEMLRSWLEQRVRLTAAGVVTLTWEESARQLLDVIYGERWYCRLSPSRAEYRVHCEPLPMEPVQSAKPA